MPEPMSAREKDRWLSIRIAQPTLTSLRIGAQGARYTCLHSASLYASQVATSTPTSRASGHSTNPLRQAVFVTTRWSMVLTAGRSDTPNARDALARLCETYWYPLYAYVRRRGYAPHDAQDLTQAFFARLLETEAFFAAPPR